MSKVKISEFSSTPGNNTDIDGINLAEGCAPSGINDAIRELMAQLKDFQAGTAGDSFNGPIGSITAVAGAFTTLSASGTTTLSGLTASTALALDASKNLVSVTNTGTGNNVLATSPTLVTPALGTPTALVGTNITGTASALNIGGNAATATTSTNVSGGTASVTTLTTSDAVTHNGGTANGVAFLNASKVLTTGSALTFDGTTLGTNRFSMTGFLATFNNDNFYMEFQRSGTPFGYIGTGSNTAGGAVTDLGIRAQNNLVFAANGTEQMRLTSTGLGIGTSSPSRRLTVASETAGLPTLGTGSGGLFLASNNGLYGLFGGVNGSNGDTWLQAMRNDAATPYNIILNPVGGNLGLGVTPSAWLGSYRAMQFTGGSVQGGTAGLLELYANNFRDSNGNFIYSTTNAAARYALSDAHRWYTAPSGTAGNAITFTQAMTLSAAGNLLLNTTSGSGRFTIQQTGSEDVVLAQVGAGGSAFTVTSSGVSSTLTAAYYITSSGFAGQITCSGSTTFYNTTSDYRLKTVIGPVADAGQRIDALQPVEYEWKADGSRTRGFLAHQFQEVYAGSVSGTKDAVDTEGKPVYQAMQASTSEVIADLVAELQSLRARVAALESI